MRTALHPMIVVKNRLNASDCCYSAKARLIARIIAEMMNRDDAGAYRAFPGFDLLARFSALSRASVKRAIKELRGQTGLPPLFVAVKGLPHSRNGERFEPDSLVYTLLID
jgi:hypothetical protein